MYNPGDIDPKLIKQLLDSRYGNMSWIKQMEGKRDLETRIQRFDLSIPEMKALGINPPPGMEWAALS